MTGLVLHGHILENIRNYHIDIAYQANDKRGKKERKKERRKKERRKKERKRGRGRYFESEGVASRGSYKCNDIISF